MRRIDSIWPRKAKSSTAHPHQSAKERSVIAPKRPETPSAVDPLRLYLYREGSAKLASEPYNPAEPGNLFAHLTNPDINITNRSVENPVVFLSLAQYRIWFEERGAESAACSLLVTLPGEESSTMVPGSAAHATRPRAGGILVLPGSEGEVEALARLLAATVTPRGKDPAVGIASRLAEWLEAVHRPTTPLTAPSDP